MLSRKQWTEQYQEVEEKVKNEKLDTGGLSLAQVYTYTGQKKGTLVRVVGVEYQYKEEEAKEMKIEYRYKIVSIVKNELSLQDETVAASELLPAITKYEEMRVWYKLLTDDPQLSKLYRYFCEPKGYMYIIALLAKKKEPEGTIHFPNDPKPTE